MQQSGEAWIAMFQRIPANLQETLVLGLRTGTEIVLQKMIRLEPDFMIIRGRVSGTQDSGRVILVPYGELSFVTMTRFMKDPEVEAIFGKSATPAVADLPATPSMDSNGVPQETPAEAVEEPTTSTPAEEAAAAKKPDQVSKVALLAKLRERLKENK